MATLTGSIAIGWVNRAAGKTMSTTTAASGYPASNLSLSPMSSRWRSTNGSVTTQVTQVDLGSATDMDVIALVGFNGEDDATRTVQTSELVNFSVVEHDSLSGNAWDATTYPALANDTPPWGRNLIYLPGTTQNARHVRFVLNDSGNPDNHLSASVLWIGPLWQPANSFSVAEDAYKFRLVAIGEPGMERYVRELEVELYGESEAEARQLESVCGERLRSGRLLVIPRPTLAATWLREAIYCTLTKLPESACIPVFTGLQWKTSLTFREVED